ncbi:MAG TPA: hypothetical protein VGK73_19985 [Polyangiaceae bacterium]
MRKGLLLFLGFASACSHDVPEHEAVLSSDCAGTWQEARFYFAPSDFETSCSGELFGSCVTSAVVPLRLSGDLLAEGFRLVGWEHGGPQDYEVTIRGRDEALAPRSASCHWSVNADFEFVWFSDGSGVGCEFQGPACNVALALDF